MRRWCLALGGLGLAILLLAVAGAITLLRGGISARRDPSALEARVARTLRNLAIPSSARATANPIPSSPAVISAGLAHFADHCAGCHANDGSGGIPLGKRLSPRAPDLRERATQELSDGELFYLIEQGVRLTGMPGWSGEGSAEGSWHLVHFIRHLPALTAEEKAEMESLNPKSPEEWRGLQEEDAFLRGASPARSPAHGSHAH